MNKKTSKNITELNTNSNEKGRNPWFKFFSLNHVGFILIVLTINMVFFSCASSKSNLQSSKVVSSPNGKIAVSVDVEMANYSITLNGKTVLETSKLGVTRADGDFSKQLKLVNTSKVKEVSDTYSMVNAKKSKMTYLANEKTWETTNAAGHKMNIVFRVSNDGVAFRYVFPDKSSDVKKINSEETSFNFPIDAKAWLQPKTESQSGFEHTNPSYEAHYELDIPVTKSSPGPNGWVYPALFKSNDVWVLITEADLGQTYCGTALQQNSPDGEYKINFPQAPEVFKNGVATLNPESTLPWETPWRILAIGDLKTVMESTLGTDLAQPAITMDNAFIKPGKSSWSWVIEKDDSTIYRVQKKYIDFAADMKWEYCLIDANWDQTIGYDSVQLLVNYGKTKNVGILLWYNSAGDWNTVKFTPKDKLLTHESRVAEFSKLQKMGIKGVKIDFFAGDGQSMMKYYEDILKDAATYKLLVNFHGATLPRGLQRTYPNFMTAEAIFGYEMITFGQNSANKAPEHSVMSAMVRNAFDPMDFTPMNLYKIPRIRRITTAAFELATSVVFLSGIQHYAETPVGMSHVSDGVKDVLRQLPGVWDDVKFIDGYPGKHYVVARKSGNKWYIAGINGENAAKKLMLDLSFLAGKKGKFIGSGEGSVADGPSFEIKENTLGADGKYSVDLKPNDGFLMVFE
ncbi:MAG TPA: glycoside hydrolase family 97 catalytic domain-containing protein [Saprospiraceae bacterium]|nr:glycoside hydrolase family 97 catalytic domain-containing protein [Saprospiraceae bacterium]